MRFIAGLAAVLTVATVAQAADISPPAEPIIAPVTSHHRASFGGSEVSYSALVGETVINDEAGKPAATIFSTSYVREDVHNHDARPVIFFFNGGPGSASHQLHAAFGPMRSSQSIDAGATASSEAAHMVVNPDSLLESADLVFIDPVGTGYSRLLPGGEGQKYWNVAGDAKSILDFIRNWLQQNNRMASPKFICGESYGGIRLATMLNNADDLKLSGVIFLSPVLDMSASMEAPGNDIPYILALPSMAADAWYQNRTDRKGRTVEATFDDARKFAETDYAAALLRGSDLPDTDRRHAADAVAHWTGLTPQFVLEHDLRVPVRTYVTALLADKGMRIGQLDGRYTGDIATFAKNRPPFDDPSMAPSDDVYKLFPTYFSDLGFHVERPYIGLALMEVNLRWDWSTLPKIDHAYTNVTPDIAAAMHRNPDLRLMVASGYYDLSTPLDTIIYSLDHADIPQKRLTTAFFEAGHSVYRNKSINAALANKLRAFVRGEPR